MTRNLDIEELRDRAAGKPATGEAARLYAQAFAQFGPQFLWSRRRHPNPSLGQVLVIADCLRREGNLPARALAAQMEISCRAAL